MQIQEVGKQILSDNPTKFYVFCGDDYGIKFKYIQKMRNRYGFIEEFNTVSEAINKFQIKSILPKPKRLYIVRYDDEFLSDMSDKTESLISDLDIPGTLVCIYESEKSTKKCMKYIPQYTVEINHVNKSLVYKYIQSDFPDMPESILRSISILALDYSNAYNICNCLTHSNSINSISEDIIKTVFGCKQQADDSTIRYGIASRNFSFTMSAIDNYSGNLDSVLYIILSTMLELDKVLCNKFCKSEYRKYSNRWSHADVYNMFSQTYEQLNAIRSDFDSPYNAVLYLISLLQFQSIPDLNTFRCEV